MQYALLPYTIHYTVNSIQYTVYSTLYNWQNTLSQCNAEHAMCGLPASNLRIFIYIIMNYIQSVNELIPRKSTFFKFVQVFSLSNSCHSLPLWISLLNHYNLYLLFVDYISFNIFLVMSYILIYIYTYIS